MTAEETLRLIEEKVIALCEAALNKGAPYLLSQLGKDLGPDLDSLKVLTRSGLSDFLASRLSSRYEIVLGGTFHNVQSVVRVGSAVRREEGERTQQSPRFNYRFWAAFSVPPVEGKRRFLDVRSFLFDDYDTESEPPAGAVEVPERFLVPDNAPDRDKTIIANIEAWADENGLDLREFHARARSQVAVEDSHRGTALHLMLGALDRRQLASTSLTLDVVEALLRRRV
ncbi:MAG: hypothetical protein Q8L54_08120 [Devosia sp.]|nr:hypothetical protein [Devosia sp.]